MSKHLSAKAFDTEREYEQYKKDERKKDRSFRDLRRDKRDRWSTKED